MAVASLVKESLVKGAGSRAFGTDATQHIDVAKNVLGSTNGFKVSFQKSKHC